MEPGLMSGTSIVREATAIWVTASPAAAARMSSLPPDANGTTAVPGAMTPDALRSLHRSPG
jgi:hypothetical protein